MRDTLAKAVESVLLDVDAAFPATFLRRWIDPGKLVGDDVEGKRKRFLDPFTYLLIAIAAQLMVAKILNPVGWRSSDAPSESKPEEAIIWVLLLAAFLSHFLGRSPLGHLGKTSRRIMCLHCLSRPVPLDRNPISAVSVE